MSCAVSFERHSGKDFFLFDDFGRSFSDGRGESLFGVNSVCALVGELGETALSAEESGRCHVERRGELASVAGESARALPTERGEVSLCLGPCEGGCGGDEWREDCEDPYNPCCRGESEVLEEGDSQRGVLWVATVSRSMRGVSAGSGTCVGGSGSDAGDVEHLLDSDRGDPAESGKGS